jgi:glycosyltransferase involved in cell wall biosynthesis
MSALASLSHSALDRLVRSTGERPATPSAEGKIVVDGCRFRDAAGRPFRVHGATYGPFAPDDCGDQFPPRAQAARDFRQMRGMGITTIRCYHVPPDWVIDLAAQSGLRVFLDVPWPKHLCFLDTRETRRAAMTAVRKAADLSARHPAVLAVSVGNEISPDMVRWYGHRRVERFLARLVGIARDADPNGLVTYASYPPTEYLDPPGIDFCTFNVYLHDRQAFRNYMFRLQNLAGDKPVVLGELGMDTLRNGQSEQAQFLMGHLAEVRLMGLGGAFVFSWTDDWFTGGHPIHDWAFGITDCRREPKAACDAVRHCFTTPLADLLPARPRVSVVVCTYNGGRTLEQCLRTLRQLDYPDYEVIVVDDGSSDNTQEILGRYPFVRAIHQPNRGLSVARNVGLGAATGEIVAYTDSDCYADPDWLTHLVYQLDRTTAAAVGGPNLTPPDGWLAACVAASPGQPTHVLETDQVAEHIPGCNMAFRREALLAINGFDPQYRKAGDDVDVCWRLQDQGRWITFAPGAFVWHHRRQGPRAYLKQQAGYGEAESLLWFKHPDRFNGRGEGKWRGTLYGAARQGIRLSRDIVYSGTFGRALFQCVYRPGPAHWAMLPSTLEWHLIVFLCLFGGMFWPGGLVVAAGLWALSLLVAAAQAWQAEFPANFGRRYSRPVVALLCYAQPLRRGWARYHTRLFAPDGTRPNLSKYRSGTARSLIGRRHLDLWDELGRDRMCLLEAVLACLDENRWTKVLDSGWCRWDLDVIVHPWVSVTMCTTQEDHEGGRRLIRARLQQRFRPHTMLLAGVTTAAAIAAMLVDQLVGAGVLVGTIAALAFAWVSGTRALNGMAGLTAAAAARAGLVEMRARAGGKSAGESFATRGTVEPAGELE